MRQPRFAIAYSDLRIPIVIAVHEPLNSHGVEGWGVDAYLPDAQRIGCPSRPRSGEKGKQRESWNPE